MATGIPYYLMVMDGGAFLIRKEAARNHQLYMDLVLLVIVLSVIPLTLVLNFVLRAWVRRVRPATRYTIFAFLLGLVTACNGSAGIMEAMDEQFGLAALLLLSTLVFAWSCILEMRKLSREF